MSENNTDNTSSEDKVSLIKDIFNTLGVVERAEFANWCHEEIEKDSGKVLGAKMQEVNDKMNNFIATAYDKVTKAGKTIYDKTNEAFESRDEDIKENKKDDSPSFFK